MATSNGWIWDEVSNIDTETSRVYLQSNDWVFGDLSPKKQKRSDWDE
jgi:hypothetical protein